VAVIVATLRGDGTIQSSLVNAGIVPHPATGESTLAFRHQRPGKARQPARDDWDTYDRAMAEERRAAVLVRPDRVYTNR
jgi:hypothetical protein